VIDKQRFDRLWWYASDAVKYGFAYRDAYEEDLRQGDLDQAYCLQPAGEVLTWVALAALSGIVGNGSTALIRSAIQRIVQKARREQLGRIEREINVLIDDQKFAKFIQYLADYSSGLPDIDPRVKRAIVVEMVIDSYLRPEYSEFYTAIAEQQRSSAAHEKLSINNRPDPTDFTGAWDSCTEDEF
jgi:hypothetical protein